MIKNYKVVNRSNLACLYNVSSQTVTIWLKDYTGRLKNCDFVGGRGGGYWYTWSDVRTFLAEKGKVTDRDPHEGEYTVWQVEVPDEIRRKPGRPPSNTQNEFFDREGAISARDHAVAEFNRINYLITKNKDNEFFDRVSAQRSLIKAHDEVLRIDALINLNTSKSA